MTLTREIAFGSLRLGAANPLFLIAGPCVIESEAHARKMAEQVARTAAEAGVPYIFKASYDKANRSSVKAFRGPGLSEGLRILGNIKSHLHLPILTDLHDASPAPLALRPARTSRRGSKNRPHRQREKSPVPLTLGHGQRRRKNRRCRQPEN